MIVSSSSERGAALLSVLLLVAIMSIAALAMLESTLNSLERARLGDARAQISWQIAGVEEVGLIGLEGIMTATNGAVTDRTANLGVPFISELNGAQVSAILEDDSNCFNLNAMRPRENAEAPSGSTIKQYQALLLSLDIPDNDVRILIASLIDWLDADSTARLNGAETGYYASLRPAYRASGMAMVSVSELRAVRGYSQQVYNQLSPLVCVRESPDAAILNVNTLKPEQAPLLSMVLSGLLEVDAADRVLSERPIGGWASVEEFLETDAVARIAPELRYLDAISIRSSHFRLLGHVTMQDHKTQFVTRYLASSNQPIRVTRRTYGAS